MQRSTLEPLKISVYGTEPTIEQLEKAGSFENLKVVPENQEVQVESVPFLEKPKRTSVVVSFAFSVSRLGSQRVFMAKRALTILLCFLDSHWRIRLFIKGIQNLFRLQFDMDTSDDDCHY